MYITHCLTRLIDARRRLRYTRLSLSGQLRPRLALGRILMRLRHHSIDLFALLQSLGRLLSRFLWLVLLRQPLGLIQRVLGISNAAIRRCQGSRTHPSLGSRSNRTLRARHTLFQGG
jgi:hypothetical protein